MNRIRESHIVIVNGAIVLLLSFLILSLAHTERLLTIIVSVALGVIAMRITSYLWHRYHVLIFYGMQSHALYSEVLGSLEEIKEFIPKIKSEEMVELVNLLCEDVEVFMGKVVEKSPNSRMSVMTVLGANLVLIKQVILPQYLDLQNQGRYFKNANGELEAAYNAINNFNSQIVTNVGLLEIGDMTDFKAAMALLDPTQRTPLN